MSTQFVRALRYHTALGQTRQPGEIYALCCADVRKLARAGLVEPLGATPDWWARSRRDLRLHDATQPGPIIACLNIWNDAPALRRTLPTWIHQVDALVVADGPYAVTGARGPSTDDLEDVLAVVPCPIQRVRMDGPCWMDQTNKRTALLQAAARAYPDGTLLIIDADESLLGTLRPLPVLDVGWVQVANPALYSRRYDQPRLIRAQPGLNYDQRHHWLRVGERLLATHQYGGPGWLHRVVSVNLTNHRGLEQAPVRQEIKARALRMQHALEGSATTGAVASDRQTGRREALRILQLSALDPAFVVGRLHTAINATTPHASICVTDGDNNPYHAPGQYHHRPDQPLVGVAWDEADVIHWHLNYNTLGEQKKRWQDKPWRVIHHHGTMLRQRASYYAALAPTHVGLSLVSNLELLQYGENLRWLPNPMPCAEYRRLRASYQPGPTFRVAHSPSKRHLKGTAQFLAAVETLQQAGLPIEAVLIEGRSYAESVALKSRCDAVFDSFWLGIQCSGLEGAAMGLPVIAGDPTVAGLYREVVGDVPYTYANDQVQLTAALERLVRDIPWREAEAKRVATYCETVHDEAAVALRYLDLLDEAFQWRAKMQARHIKPDPLVPPSEMPRHPRPKMPIGPLAPAPLTRTA